MNKLQEFKFKKVYELADLIEHLVDDKEGFWHYDEDFFINSATKFSKDTLLHLYIVTATLNYYRRGFRKNGDDEDEESMQRWYSLFETYQIDLKKFNFEGKQRIVDWFDRNIESFKKLFDTMADEVFYILFANRQFLLNFNNLTVEAVKDIEIPFKFLTRKGTIKRTSIPSWVRIAVFHRDKGRCVFCFTDLTNIINTLTSSNYDHIVPLDLFGTNDPCNIQLTCEKCNKSKTNKDGETTSKYIPWWIR